MSRGQALKAEKEILIQLHGDLLKQKRGSLLHAAKREH